MLGVKLKSRSFNLMDKFLNVGIGLDKTLRVSYILNVLYRLIVKRNIVCLGVRL